MNHSTLKNIVSMVCLVLFMVFVGASHGADVEALGRQSESAAKYQDALDYYTRALQDAPDGSAKDQQLREKIIILAQNGPVL